MATTVKSLHATQCLTPENLAKGIKTGTQRAAAKRALSKLKFSEAEQTRLLAGTYKRSIVPFDEFYAKIKAGVDARTATPEFVSHLTDGLLYSASARDNSKSTLLSRLRAKMKADGVGQSLIDATFRPNMTLRRNATSDSKQQEKQLVQITVPERWRTPGALHLRLTGWKPDRVLSGEDTADLLVALSGRPNELKSLAVDAVKNTVTGALKKRGDGAPVEYVGSIPAAMAQKSLEIFQGMSSADQGKALRAARKFVQEMPNWAGTRNNTLRDLRAFGAHLAVERAKLEGGGATDAARMEVRAKALRHQFRRPAVHHYAHVAAGPA